MHWLPSIRIKNWLKLKTRKRKMEMGKRVCEKALQLNGKRSLTTKLKIELRTWKDVSLKKTYKWSTGIWKVFSITNRREMKFETIQWDSILHLLDWLLSKRQKTANFYEDIENGKPLYTLGGNVNWYSLDRKHFIKKNLN